MAGYIEDRWYRKGPPDPETGKPTREETDLHGVGMRYKVAGIPGVRARSFPEKRLKDARAWLADAQSKSRAGEFIDPRRGQILLVDYIEQHWWPTMTGDPATLETIANRVWGHIVPRLGQLSLNAIKVEQLRRWLKDVEADIGPSTINAVWGYLSVILTAAVEGERIPRNYCKSSSVKPPAVPERKARAWTRERVFAVREAIDPRYRLMVDLGVGAGLRQGEMLGLSVDDIDTHAGVIRIRRQVRKVDNKLVFAPPKRGKSRVVPLSQHLHALISAHMEARPPKKVELPWINSADPETDKQIKDWAPQTHELILTSPWGKAIRRDSWNRLVWKEALVGAGVIPPPMTRKQPVRGTNKFRTVKSYAESRQDGLHATRHTFVSQLLGAGTSIVAVSNYVGHKDPSITLRIYAHMMPESDERGRAAIDAWFEGES
jgi:integrase